MWVRFGRAAAQNEAERLAKTKFGFYSVPSDRGEFLKVSERIHFQSIRQSGQIPVHKIQVSR